MITDGYSEKITVKYSEIEQNLAMKPYALLNFLQDIASKNAEDRGFGYSTIYPKNYAWFLIKYRMEFEEYPFDVLDLKLTTEPRGCNKLFAFRDFELEHDGKVIARIASQWAIVDISTRSIVPILNAIGDLPGMPILEKREDDLKYNKITPVTNVDLEKIFEVRYNDLDVNGHANNGNYIVWAFEPLSFDFRHKYRIKAIDMMFKKEAKYGEKLASQVQFKDENTTLHKLVNVDGDELFISECLWEKI